MRRLLVLVVLSLVALACALLWLRDVPRGEVELARESASTSNDPPRVDLAEQDVEPARAAVPEPPVEPTSTPLDPERERAELEAKLTRFVDAASIGRLEVRVLRDEDAQPLEGAEVWLVTADAREAPAPVTTDATGTARFVDLQPGTWTVTVQAERRASASGGAMLTVAEPARTIEVRLELVHEVTARVFGLEGIDASARDEIGLVATIVCGHAGERTATFTPIPCRSRRIDPPEALAWKVEVRGDPVCLHATLGGMILAAAPVDPWSGEVALRVDAETLCLVTTPIAVRVVADDTGAPLAGAVVALARRSGNPVERATDVEGRARFDERFVGDVVATVRADGYAKLELALLRPLAAEVVLRVHVGRAVAGRMIDQDGAPMPRAKVAVYAAEQAGSGAPARLLRVVDTDLAGGFELAGLAPGLYAVGTHAGSGYPILPRVQDWSSDSLVLADCRTNDARGLLLRGRRWRFELGTEDWNPPAYPRK